MKATGEPLIDRNLPLLVGICVRCWHTLPAHSKRYLEPEDVILGAVAHLWKAQQHYTDSRGATTTFVSHVVTNYCVSLARKENAVSRPCTILLTDTAVNSGKLSVGCQGVVERSATVQRTLEALIADASDSLRHTFALFVRFRSFEVWTKADLYELRKLAEAYGLTRDELAYALRYVQFHPNTISRSFSIPGFIGKQELPAVSEVRAVRFNVRKTTGLCAVALQLRGRNQKWRWVLSQVSFSLARSVSWQLAQFYGAPILEV